MAACAIGSVKNFIRRNYNRFEIFYKIQSPVVNNIRHNHMFKHLQEGKVHDTEYTYEISKDPKEWEFVEKLMPLETVPTPEPKENYPSGWRPPKEEALKLPYYVERSKNHMLPVYLNIHSKGQKISVLKRIHGDLWLLHNELKAHIEELKGKKIASAVLEGSNVLNFKGDFVYYIEQWLLSKGF